MSNEITNAHLLHVLRNDQIKLADALVNICHVLHMLFTVLILMSLTAWYLLSGWQSEFAAATAAAIFAVLLWAAYTLPPRAALLITDLGPESSGPPPE
jgi:hypothetical protein